MTAGRIEAGVGNLASTYVHGTSSKTVAPPLARVSSGSSSAASNAYVVSSSTLSSVRQKRPRDAQLAPTDKSTSLPETPHGLLQVAHSKLALSSVKGERVGLHRRPGAGGSGQPNAFHAAMRNTCRIGSSATRQRFPTEVSTGAAVRPGVSSSMEEGRYSTLPSFASAAAKPSTRRRRAAAATSEVAPKFTIMKSAAQDRNARPKTNQTGTAPARTSRGVTDPP